jgi:hypothetical protein
MRILHQVNSLDIGGVETFVYRLCKYSNEDVFVYSHKDGKVREWLEKIGIYASIKEFGDDIKTIISNQNIDIVVFHTGSFLPTYAKELKERFPLVKFITVLHTIAKTDEWVDKIISISQAVHFNISWL